MMNPEQWKQIEELYDAALKLDEERRASFLDHACYGAEELRQEVAALLASDRKGPHITSPKSSLTVKRCGGGWKAGGLISAYIEKRSARLFTFFKRYDVRSAYTAEEFETVLSGDGIN